MAGLSLNVQVGQLTDELRERISNLKPNDPAKDWFSLELDSLATSSNDALSLDEANARLHAMKQLSHLVQMHHVRLMNPQFDQPVEDLTASILTVEARLPDAVLNAAREMRFSIEPRLLHEPASDNEQFDPVSPTAKVVGYLRGLDRSLKITEELSVETQGQSLMHELGILDMQTRASMAVLFQSRYHALNAAIAKSDVPAMQIVEFAAGISPRGFQWSQMSPGTIYIESDLAPLMIHKAKLIRNAILASQEDRRGVLHCCAADVLDLASINSALSALDTTKPFTIVTEGLLLYFGPDEMSQFMHNIQSILVRHPGSTWVTDLVTKANLHELLESHAGVADGVRRVFSLTGRKVVTANPFETDSCITRCFHEHGLQVESTIALKDVTPNLEFDVPIPQSSREQIVGTRKIWRVIAAAN